MVDGRGDDILQHTLEYSCKLQHFSSTNNTLQQHTSCQVLLDSPSQLTGGCYSTVLVGMLGLQSRYSGITYIFDGTGTGGITFQYWCELFWYYFSSGTGYSGPGNHRAGSFAAA